MSTILIVIAFDDVAGPVAETPQQTIDYEFAQQELMIEEMGNDPIQDAIVAIEKEHEKDKEGEEEEGRVMALSIVV